MLKYVMEEVDRVKRLFEEKERRSVRERDAALEAQKEADARAIAAQVQAESAAARAADAEAHLGALPQQLQVLHAMVAPMLRF